METNRLERAARFIEAAEKAEALRQSTTRGLSAVLKRVHAPHIYKLEALIKRYQDALGKVSSKDIHPVEMIRQLDELAQTYVPQAVAMGYQRGLNDLRSNGWLTNVGTVTPAHAPVDVVKSILLENTRYLTTSLLPDLQTGMSDAARKARMELYGHYLWKAAERATVQALKDFDAFTKTQNRKDKVREGSATSGNYGHAGRPGERGGSSAGDAKVKHGTHVLKVSEAEGTHYFDFPSSASLRYEGFPTDTRIKNQLLSEIDRNIDKIPGQVSAVDEVFLTDKIHFIDANGNVSDKLSAVGITLSGLGDRTVVGFNSKNIAMHILEDNGFSIADRLGKSTSSYSRAVADHEMGHVFYKTLDKADKISWQVTWAKNADMPFTRYAQTSSREGFAEAYAAYINNATMPSAYRSYMDRVLDHHTLKEAEAEDDQPIAYICGFSDGPTLHIYKDRVEQVCDPKRIPIREGGSGSGNYGHSGRPGQRGGSSGGGSSIVPAIVGRALQRDGGITISTTGVRPRSGYVVAGIRDSNGEKVERVFNAPKIDNVEIDKFIQANAETLKQPGYFIGGWVDDGKTYLDVSEVHEDRQTALDHAESRDEIAAFDLGKFENIYTREDHLRPSESKAARAA